MSGHNPYWGLTDSFLARNPAPICSHCGEQMFPVDDHGRFACFCDMSRSYDAIARVSLTAKPIPQVDVSGMMDAQKAKIPAINRLHGTVTAAEAEFFRVASGGPDAMDSPEYQAAVEALERERGGK